MSLRVNAILECTTRFPSSTLPYIRRCRRSNRLRYDGFYGHFGGACGAYNDGRMSRTLTAAFAKVLTKTGRNETDVEVKPAHNVGIVVAYRLNRPTMDYASEFILLISAMTYLREKHNAAVSIGK